MMLNQKDFTCWIITEGMAGTENQCLGVAEALRINPVIKQIKLGQPWKTLSPYLGFESKSTFSPALRSPWPDLLITSGRKSIAAARYIKKQSAGKTFTLHIQDPRVSPAGFDLVAVPEHDPTRGPNVITTLAAPNRITDEKLEAAKAAFSDFEKLPSPRVAVLIGGKSQAYDMSAATMTKLAGQLGALDAGLMITASRRTGAENEKILHETLKNSDAFIWDGSGDNPYMGMLAWADTILVTADSVSMLSEACTTGKPVYMIPLDGGGSRLDKLHTNLQQSGALRIFEGTLDHWTYEPLRDAEKIANELKERLRDRP